MDWWPRNSYCRLSLVPRLLRGYHRLWVPIVRDDKASNYPSNTVTAYPVAQRDPHSSSLTTNGQASLAGQPHSHTSSESGHYCKASVAQRNVIIAYNHVMSRGSYTKCIVRWLKLQLKCVLPALSLSRRYQEKAIQKCAFEPRFTDIEWNLHPSRSCCYVRYPWS